MTDDIDKTFNRLKQVDYKIMMNILKRNEVNSYVLDFVNHKYEPSPFIRAKYEQLCLENGWSLEEYICEINRKIFEV